MSSLAGMKEAAIAELNKTKAESEAAHRQVGDRSNRLIDIQIMALEEETRLEMMRLQQVGAKRMIAMRDGCSVQR